MKICCPECGYTRQTPEDRLPEGVVVAVCPQCGCRFRFSRKDGVLGVVSERPRPVQRRDGDVFPPPGAVIPGSYHSDPEQPQHTGERDRPEERETEDRKREEDPRDRERQEECRDEYQGPEQWGRIPDEDEVGPDNFNPWESAPGSSGWLSAFYQTCIRVMFAGERFFSSLRRGPYMRALVFYLIMCVLQTAMAYFWIHMYVEWFKPMNTDPQVGKIIEALSSQSNLALSLLLRCAMLTAQIYLFTGLLYLTWRIVAPDKADFSLIFKVLAYAEAPGILCLVPVIGNAAALIWGFVCILTGCRAALKLNWRQTMLGFLPLLLLMVPSVAQIFLMLGG